MNLVEDNSADSRFELAIEGSHEVAAAYYVLRGDRIVLTHTVVPERFSGQGLGSRLARGTFDAIRQSGRITILRCPFMIEWFARHPQYADIVESEKELD